MHVPALLPFERFGFTVVERYLGRSAWQRGLSVDLGCIIMASGASERFRAAGGMGSKLLVPVDGPLGEAPLVAQTAASVPVDIFETAVVAWLPEVAHAVESSRLNVAVVNQVSGAQPHKGDTVRAGAAYADARGWDGLLFLPGDQPLVARESFQALAEAFERDPSCAYRLGWRGVPGSPVLFPARCAPTLMVLRGSDGGSSLLNSGALEVALVEARDACELLDVDVSADLDRIASACRHRLRSESE